VAEPARTAPTSPAKPLTAAAQEEAPKATLSALPPVVKDPRSWVARLAKVAPNHLHASCGSMAKITRRPAQWVKTPVVVPGKTDRALQQTSVITFGGNRLEVTETNPEPRNLQVSIMSITWNGKPIERTQVMEASGGMNGVWGPYCSPRGDLVVLLVAGFDMNYTHYLFHRNGKSLLTSGGVSTFVEEGYWHVFGADDSGYVLIDTETLEPRLMGEDMGRIVGWFRQGDTRLAAGEHVLDVTRWDAPRKVSDDEVMLWGGFWMNTPSGPDAATPYLVMEPETLLHPEVYLPAPKK
jgi:hypothetical protein